MNDRVLASTSAYTREPATRKFRIKLVTAGGTIAKSYDQHFAVLRSVHPIIVGLVHSLRLEGAEVRFKNLIQKDSLDLDDKDRNKLVSAVRAATKIYDAVVVTHGTDTLSATAELLVSRLPNPLVPVIFTGAMVPHVVMGSDGMQNVTEALFACRLLRPGVYVVFHGRVLTVPGAVKDHDILTFVQQPGTSGGAVEAEMEP